MVWDMKRDSLSITSSSGSFVQGDDAARSARTKPGKRRERLRVFLSLAVCVIAFAGIQNLLLPKYMTSLWEGAMIREYYGTERGNQVIFLGDCEVYENFSPVTLWEEYGITSYIRGGPNQLIWQSYYLLEDTFRYEKPDVVVFSVLAVKDDKTESEAYNRLNIDGMRLSPSKLRAIKASKTEEETVLSYLLPLLRYHDRWDRLSCEDLEYFFRRDRVTHQGYYMRCDVRPVEVVPAGPRLKDYGLPERAMAYLDRIRILCEANGAELVLIKAPSIYPHWYDEWDSQVEDYAAGHGLRYYNMLKAADEIGIDFQTDTYDAGLHMNRDGAEKLSRWFGAELLEAFALEDRRGDEKTASTWGAIAADYYAMAEAQLRDIDELGHVDTFTYRAR